jgi:hypothetical protein
MKISKKILGLTAPLALLALGGCTNSFRADVSRYQMMPPPQGQSFVVQSHNPRLRNGLEFQQYAGMVTQALTEQGYQPASDARSATFIVNIDYGVDNGREKVTTRPGFGPGWGTAGFGWGRPFYPRFGPRSAFYYGWYDPWGPGWGYPEVESYTVFTSYLDVDINRASDGQRLFEGTAKARSTTDNLTRIVPGLVEAMFTGFPGRSGEDVRITIPEGDGPATIRDRN